MMVENMKSASIVRGSDEDFKYIFGAESPDATWAKVKEFCDCLVYTANVEGVHVRTKSYSGRFPVNKITPVSTIGAGDNFNAGMIAALYWNGIKRTQLASMGEEGWSKVISTGVSFATDVCMSYENYISEEFAAGIKGL
jgi:fructokinase